MNRTRYIYISKVDDGTWFCFILQYIESGKLTVRKSLRRYVIKNPATYNRLLKIVKPHEVKQGFKYVVKTDS